MQGLQGRGWSPAVDFSFDHQIVVGVPGKGCYIFYDKDQLSATGVYKQVQDSVDRNPNFVAEFRRRTDELFGAIFFKCINIDSENLPLLSDSELADMYTDFLSATMAAPIITVQLWGIEALLDPGYKIISFLETALNERGKNRDFEMYRGTLTVNIGETVAMTEQKNFFQVAIACNNDDAVRALFETESPDALVEKLPAHPRFAAFIDTHIHKYEWINTEYVSGGWTKVRWMELFKNAIIDPVSPSVKLAELENNYEKLVAERERVIAELVPPSDVRHALSCLAELIAERDWSKGYFTRILLSYHKLLDEAAARLGVPRSNLFSYTYTELEAAMRSRTSLSSQTVSDRQTNGFALVIKGRAVELASGSEAVRAVIEREGISEPFDKVINVTEFKGLAASRGIITAKARIIEDASSLDELESGEILVTYMTTIEFTPAFRKAGAIVTDEGAMSCHAAIISREFKLPCIVGTKIATRVIETGDLVEVDALKGTVKILERVSHEKALS